jgi:hypothetical protein
MQEIKRGGPNCLKRNNGRKGRVIKFGIAYKNLLVSEIVYFV